jgi:dihydroorotase
LRPGSPGDIVVFDADERWTVDTASLLSRSRNTPFATEELLGRVRYTWVGGHLRYELPREASAAGRRTSSFAEQGSL